MIEEQQLTMLRCPLDPKREAKLELDDIKVICSRCRVQFRSRDGFLSLVVESAMLPEGCAKIGDLECQVESNN